MQVRCPRRALGGLAGPAKDIVVRTFSIVTTRPNEQMAGLHDRMPVVLPESAWDLAGSGSGRSRRAAGPVRADRRVALRIEPVADLVNNVGNDGPTDPADRSGEVARVTVEPPGLFDEVSR
jgi:putative SOS response-associated peptidase YedK